jgi:hypothetical protein
MMYGIVERWHGEKLSPCRKDFALVPERAGPAESGVLSSTGEKLDNGSFGAHSCSYDMGSLFLANLFLPRLWL